MLDLKYVLDYVDNHIEERISLVDIANEMGYSPCYFSRLFSETMKLSVTTYIRIRKFQHAIIDLDKGKSVLETAMKYGFESHEGFTRSFRQLYGFVPEVLKNQNVTYTLPNIIIPNIRSDNFMEKNNSLSEDMYAMFNALFQQSLLEKTAGFCEEIQVKLLDDNFIEISDDGRGIPLTEDIYVCKERINNLFANSIDGRLAYNSMDDFSSIEVNVVCSLSEKLSVEVYKEGKRYKQDYVRGIAMHELQVEPCDKMHGIKVIFKPDTEIFGDIEWNPAEVEKICGKYFDGYYSEQ